MLPGETASCGGVKPIPTIEFRLFPPLLAKVRTLLKLPDVTGLKLTLTSPVWPGATLYGLPLRTVKGGLTVTLPARSKPPLLIT